MEYVNSKALLVAAGVLVTIMITSGVFIILGYTLDIYSNVAKLDYASLGDTDEFAKYNCVDLYGYEILNMLNKYKNDDEVLIKTGDINTEPTETVANNTTKKDLAKNMAEADYGKKYVCRVYESTTSTGRLVKIVYKAG